MENQLKKQWVPGATQQITRGDIFFVDLSNGVGCEQSGVRPVLVIQNNIGNFFSPSIVIACITGKKKKENLPTHVILPRGSVAGLIRESTVMLEQIRAIDKQRIITKLGKIPDEKMAEVNQAIAHSLGFDDMKSVWLNDTEKTSY